MTNQKDPAPALTVNRRKEIFVAIRGSKLTGLRGRSVGESGVQPARSSRGPAYDDEPQTMRRVRLGRVIEDETDKLEARDARRYSEPND